MHWEKRMAERGLVHLAEGRGCAVAFSAEAALVCGPPEKVEGLLTCLDLGDEPDLASLVFDGVACTVLPRSPLDLPRPSC